MELLYRSSDGIEHKTEHLSLGSMFEQMVQYATAGGELTFYVAVHDPKNPHLKQCKVQFTEGNFV